MSLENNGIADRTRADVAVRFAFFRVIPVAALVAGLVLIVSGAMELYYGKASGDWPTAKGVVVYSECSIRTSFPEEYPKLSNVPVVRYEYYVDGKPFRGDRVIFGSHDSGDLPYVLGVINRYWRGKEVPVYYNPSSHEMCVLEPGMQRQPWFNIAFGQFFAILGIGLIAWSRSNAEKSDIICAADNTDDQAKE
ncbi:MAG: DUF3592 domain-containing protein [Planctomycetes bacterium]|nr:DUF3592 domain-containing protein [Planctomycetota bacterium]